MNEQSPGVQYFHLSVLHYLRLPEITQRGGREQLWAPRNLNGPPVIKALGFSFLIHRKMFVRCKEPHNFWWLLSLLWDSMDWAQRS